MVEGRAAKNYNFFIDTVLFYQKLFENSGDISSILDLPYPLYHDIILHQVDEKKREKRMNEQAERDATRMAQTRKK